MMIMDTFVKPSAIINLRAATLSSRRGEKKMTNFEHYVAKHNNYAEEIKIAADLRKYVPRGRAVLFHGTRFACSILKSNCLIYNWEVVDAGVNFTRLLHVGIYFARTGWPNAEELRRRAGLGS
jgi:hypothetical protein